MAEVFFTNREELDLKNTFEALINRAEAIQSLCKDDVIPATQLHMSDDIKLNGMDLSTLAAGHLCGKLGVPSRYFSRLIDEKKSPLAAENINTWLEDDKRKFMLRQYDGHIRGVLSGSYSKYDAPDILKSVQDVFGPKHFKLKGSYINEERLHVRLVENEMLPIDGEDLFAGITLDSSDVGRSALSVKFFIYKQVCTNGLTIAKSGTKLFTQKHIGITSENFKESLEEGLKSFEDIKTEVIEMIKNTHEIPVGEDLEALAEKVKNATKLSDDDVDEVLVLMANRYEPTQWGLINGITEVAQKFSLERRLELEEIAGSMLAS